MNFERFMTAAIALFHQYPLVAAVIALVLLLLIYKNPKESFKFLLLLVFLAAVFYAISLFSGTLSTGAKGKDQMINKTRDLVD